MNGFPASPGRLFRSLRHRNYRLFYSGQTVSVMGTWLQNTVQGWLVYQLTKSPAWLGRVGFAAQLPPLLLGVLAGVYADRWNRRRALVATQALAMTQAALLAALTLGGVVQIWHIMALALMLGLVNAFDMPLRQSFVVEMVGRKDLHNALALNSMMFNMARIIGPAAAGFLLAATGPGQCFLLNALSYIFVIWALLRIKMPAAAKEERRASVLASLREGLGYMWQTPFIRNPLLLLTLVSFVIAPLMAQMPAVAAEMLHGGAKTLGLLISSIGVGAILSGLDLASRKSPRGMGRIIAVSSLMYGLAMMAFSFCRSTTLCCLLLVLAGMGLMRQTVGCNTLIQTMVQPGMRGRVMGLYAITFSGLAPLGNLALGWMASRFGVHTVYLYGGAWVACMAALFAASIPGMKKCAGRNPSQPDCKLAETLEEII